MLVFLDCHTVSAISETSSSSQHQQQHQQDLYYSAASASNGTTSALSTSCNIAASVATAVATSECTTMSSSSSKLLTSEQFSSSTGDYKETIARNGISTAAADEDNELARIYDKQPRTATPAALHLQHLPQSFVNCLAKSPELLVCNARNNFVQYDTAIDEMKTSKTLPHEPKQVRFHDAHAVRSPPLRNDREPNADSEVTDDPNDENYKKVPVRDLISTFEMQTRPVIRYKVREDKVSMAAAMIDGSADVNVEPAAIADDPPCIELTACNGDARNDERSLNDDTLQQQGKIYIYCDTQPYNSNQQCRSVIFTSKHPPPLHPKIVGYENDSFFQYFLSIVSLLQHQKQTVLSVRELLYVTFIIPLEGFIFTIFVCFLLVYCTIPASSPPLLYIFVYFASAC